MSATKIKASPVMRFLGVLKTTLGYIFDARLMMFLIPSLVVLYWDPVDWPIANTIMYYTAVTVFLAGVSHILRRVYFPYLDLEAYVKKALDEPQSSAIVFASVVVLLCCLMVTMAMWSH